MESALRGFLKRYPDAKEEPGLAELLSQQASLDQVATTLESLLTQPVFTLALGGALRSCGSLLRLLSFLVERRLAATPVIEDGGFAAMLVTVLELAPHCSRVVQRYLEGSTPPQELALRGHAAAQAAGTAAAAADADLVSVALRALQLLPGLRQHSAWAAGSFMTLLHHQSYEVRWASLQAVALLLNMSDASRTALASQLLSSEEQVRALASWQARRNAVALEQAAMWLHVPSACTHCQDGAAGGASAASGAGGSEAAGSTAEDAWGSSSGAPAAVDPFGLPPARGFVEVCGIELACRDAPDAAGREAAGPGPPGTPAGPDAAGTAGATAGHCFVATSTVRRNLEAAALVLCQGLPLLLEGPPGAGKTRLIEELAARTGNAESLVRIHLDDQMDAKSLLGAYVCTAVPGEFAWQPGPLTQAVSEGRWVLVEDINMAPGDVLAALAPLLESRVLHVSSRGMVVPAAPGFQLIATVTSSPASGGGGHGAYGMSNMVKELLGGLWRTVRVDAPSDPEQMAMLSTAYPSLLPLLPAAVGTLCLIQAAGGHGASHNSSSASAVHAAPVARFQLTEAGPQPMDASVGGAADQQGQQAQGQQECRRGSWHALAEAALEAAGVRRGDLALHLGRHFSLRDVFKWCDRMMHLHGGLLRGRGYNQALRAQRKASSSTPSLTALAAAAPATVDAPPPDLSALDARLREAAFVEAADCFAALVARPEARLKLLKALAALWCAPAGSPEQWEQLAKPQLSLVEGASFGEERRLLVGRVTLPLADEQQQQRDGAAAAKGSAGAAAGAGGAAPGGSGGTFARTGHAMRVMERIAAALSCNEPVLLVGETGTGKTTMLSRMAGLVGAQLVSFNLSQQTDSSDLLGGFKPVEPRDALAPLLPTFTALIRRTWTRGNNDEYLARVAKLAERRKWSQLLAAFRGALSKLHDAGLVASATAAAAGGAASGADGGAADAADAAEAAAEKGGKPAKKRKVGGAAQPLSEALRHEWRVFSSDLAAAERAAAVAEGGFAFAFVEGVLVKALRNGWWLLLDEINLAPAEVLERLAGLLETSGGGAAGAGATGGGSVVLLERGDTVAVPRHPNFRLVAAMNPATDAGKHELPAALRNRFTEMWVPEPAGREDLAALVAAYLAGVGPTPPVDAAVDFYLAAKAEADARLVDGAGQKPAYNLRTLARALDYARAATPSYGLQRALYDGAAMAFLTQLAPAAAPRMEALIAKHLLPGVKNVRSLLRAPPEPAGSTHVLFEAFWLERGPLELPAGGREEDGAGRRFVMTPSVRQHLTNLARAVLIRKHPILLQGPTSAGKTSLVAYLAAQTGHTFLRINNHEHTDLQEYLGSYVSDAAGRLVFREGPLVQAVRRGWWVVLDELNLAPTEVLEALNRLLDDNRELLVPELGEVVRPHPHFMLFATQNPPGGAYAGRKVLSRAFRSRFLELHIDDIPDSELAEILEKRCAIAPSYAAKLVSVQRELQRRRNAASVFAGKHGFITPRDLFRWAERGAVGYEALAADGALLLGERLRSGPERAEVVGVVEKIMNVKVDLEAVYSSEGDAPIRALQAALQEQPPPQQEAGGSAPPPDSEDAAALQNALRGVVWTRSMRRMYTLVERCLRHSEPVLLVGETGTGKTTVCQLLALMRRQHLHILNCNQHTETSDFLGGFRPTRGRERALGTLRGAAMRVAASPLLAALGLAAPAVPEELGPQAVAPLAAAVAEAVAAAGKAVAELDAKRRKEVKKAVRAAVKAAGGAGGAASADLDEQLRALQADGAAAAAAATEARAPFAWADGPLVTAMRRGDMILVDEINLAEDAVLERLNSVLEPGRTLTLAERGGEGAEVVVAAPGFRLLATMNPGGDFGKKELSPALANRFTTIWVPAMEDPEEMRAILEARLADSVNRAAIAERLLRFFQEYARLQPGGSRQPLSVRDLLAWVGFVNATAPQLGPLPAYAHGAHLTLLDGIGLGVGLPIAAAATLRSALCTFLASQLPPDLAPHARLAEGRLQALEAAGLAPPAPPAGQWGIPPFFVPLADPTDGAGGAAGGFALRAPTTARNAFRLLRAMQLRKAVLLEGSPGVGKTSLVAALAKCVGQTLVRINLSEQTDMMDLLGADLPAPGGTPGQFAWCDGPLLGALRAGHWVLLDELNLAGQSVLEGLNALLDHRSEVFIPELGAVFRCHPGFRLFAAQNPVGEGGGRKGLPRSFLNRFTRVSVELLRRDDLLFIASALHPRLPEALLRRMVRLLDAMQAAASPPSASAEAKGEEGGSGGKPEAVTGVRDFAAAGGPWEFNLRDLLRWCDLVEGSVPAPPPGTATGAMEVDGDGGAASDGEPVATGAAEAEAVALDAAAQHFARMLFSHRLRTLEDRAKLARLFAAVWGAAPAGWTEQPPVLLSPRAAVVGRAIVPRAADPVAAAASGAVGAAAAAAAGGAAAQPAELHLLPWSLPLLESLMQTLSRSWMALLVGGPGAGKTALARSAAALAGVRLLEISLTSGTDTSDLLGSFEQLEPERRVQEASDRVQQLAQCVSQTLLASTSASAGAPAGVDGALLAAAQEVQASWAAHVAATAAVERQADAPSPIAAAAQRVERLRGVVRTCRAAIATLDSSTAAADASAAAALLTAAADVADAELHALAALLADEAAAAVGGRFEWVDGALTRAIERGGWVLLEGANLCNPTVLDRLNPLLEPGGSLYLNECGQTAAGPRVIRPHPDFRLILALDPRHGEVSRAMRNRGIEIFLLPPPPPPASPLPSAGSADAAEVVDRDVEAVVRSQGVAGKRLLRALARAHGAMCRLCARSHKRPPGLREAATAASLAGALLARGWGLEGAVRTGWTHVYLRGQGFSAAEAAEAQGLLEQLIREGVRAAALIAAAAGEQADAMDWDGAPAAAAAPETETEAERDEHGRDVLLCLGGADGTLSGEQALTELSAQPLVPRRLEAGMLAAPAAWPVATTVQRLASASAVASAERDVSLLAYLLGACAAASTAAVGQPEPALVAQLREALRSSDDAVSSAAVQLLGWLPSEVVAPVLHGGDEVATPRGSADSVSGGGALPSGAAVHLQQLAWAAAQCLAQRASRLDAQARSLLCDAVAAGQAHVAAVLAGAGVEAIAAGAAAPVPQLASLAGALVRGVATHPVAEALAASLRDATAAGGMPAELLQLQPVDVRYSHLLQPYLPGVPAAEWAAVEQRAARLRAAQVALGARLLLQHATGAADAAVASGAASPLQMSYWRFLRPEERAATDAEHPAVDCLYPLLSALADLEASLLQPHPHGLPDAAWGAEPAALLAATQRWRGALWRISHGLLHLPLAVSPSSGQASPNQDAGSVSAVVHRISLDEAQLTWTWTRTDKALGALLEHPDVAAALAPELDSSGSAPRLEYLRSQMREALGLAARPAKPLAWRLCGKPVLPSSLELLRAMVEGRVIAAAAAAAALDTQGRPAGLHAAGIDLDASILSCAAAAAAAAAAGEAGAAAPAAGSVAGVARTVEELLGEEAPAVRQQVAEAVALALCVDPGLRRSVGQGLAMLGAMPLMEALRPGGRRQALVAGTASRQATASESLAEQGTGIVAALREALQTRVREAVGAVLACPSEDEWMMRQGAVEALAAADGVVAQKAVQTAQAASQQQPQLLLPSSWMASRTCRQLQAALLALQDCVALRGQLPLLAEAEEAAVRWAAEASGQQSAAGSRIRALAARSSTLADKARAAVDAAIASSSRSPADVAACQQLVWVLDELEQQLRQPLRVPAAAAGARSGGRPGSKLSAAAAAGPQLDMQQLSTVVLPALSHDIWLRWHAANWRDSMLVGSPAGGSHGGNNGGWTLASAAALDAPLLSACVLRVLHSSASQVQSKAMRLRQLRAAVATLLSQRREYYSTSRHHQALLPAPPAAAPAPAVEPVAAPAAKPSGLEWRSLTCLLVQLLAAHSSSLPQQDMRSGLQALCSRLLSAASATDTLASGDAAFAAAAAAVSSPGPNEVCGQLATILQHTEHSTLAELLQPVLLPAAAAVCEGLRMSSTTQASSSTSNSTSASSAQLVLHAAAERRAARDAELSLRGRAWLLLGLLRLHLVTPPAGIDPAGKYALKRRHLEGLVVHELQPELLVRQALQQLPGGPSEAAHLAELTALRAQTVAAAEAAAARCVPRPRPSQYPALQREAAEFAASLAAPARVLAMVAGLTGASGDGAASAALQEADVWQANARAWCERFGQQYAWYPDLSQPVQLAVLEMVRGISLLTAASPASPSTSAALVPQSQLGPLGATAVGLMRFPTTVPPGPAAADTAAAAPLGHLPARLLAEPQALQLLQQLARAAALQTPPPASALAADPAKAAQAADLAGYEIQLRATRVALHALAREALARGGGAAAASAATPTDGADGGDTVLPSLERLLSSLVEQWAALKAYEEAAAEEEAQQFKTKTSSATFMNEDAEAEATYRLSFPDHYAAFRDVAPLEPGEEAQEEEEEEERLRKADGGGEEAAATAAQARSSAARQLLDGELLSDVVRLHAAVYGSLAAQLAAAMAAASADGEASASAATAASAELGADMPQDAFVRSYELGAQLMAAVGVRLDASVDGAAETGHLFRLCLEHMKLNRAAAATAADAAEPDGPARRAAARSAAAAGGSSRRRGDVIFGDEGSGIDIQQPCVEEMSLLQEPVSAMESRLRGLLADYPDHPLLVQLRAVCLRVLSMPLTSPLKTALTGLELILSRAQVWEETAAQFVSLKAQLGPVAALATRWRRLELSSWKGLLRRVASRHAAGAHRSWFHLHRLLAATALHGDAADGAGGGADAAAAALAASGVAILIGMESVPTMIDANAAPVAATDAAAGAAGPAPLTSELEMTYRRVASTLESFVQTSTLGEFRSRLGLLHAFACHVEVRRRQGRQPGAGAGDVDGAEAGPLAAPVAAALHNLVRYYGQFLPAVEGALAEGMAPLEKDLQDFVQLARWDDRGYYAMRASTEKAQRYLHRLSRRAEEVLRQPAATALATAAKGMGVAELAAAAAAATRAADAMDVEAAEPAAAGKDGAAADAKGKAKAAKAAAAVKPKKVSAAKAAAEAEANDLAGVTGTDSDAAAGVDGGDREDERERQRWAALCSDVQQRLSQDAALQQALAAAAASLADGGAAASSAYLPRLPQLASRLGRVLGEALLPRSGGSAGAADAADADADAPAGLMSPDELVATAIVRSHELRSDVSKGARMRKRQALADLYEALEAQGLSRRQTAVPPHDRDVAAWFKHPEPTVAPLWQQPQPAAAADVAAADAAVAAAASWSKADDYFFRCMARLQKLWRGSQQPHRDLSLQEVSAARRLCEHALYVARRQRDALGEAASTVAALTKLAAWMQEEGGAAAATAAALAPSDAAAGQVSSSSTGLLVALSQAECLAAVQRQKEQLASLAMLAAESVQLLDACVATAALPAAQARLAAAVAAARTVSGVLAGCKRRLDTALQGCSVATGGSGGGAGDVLVWVTRGTVQVALENSAALVKAEADLVAAVRATASEPSDAAAAAWVPALGDLYAAVAAAAAEASALLASQKPTPSEPQQEAAAAGVAALPADLVASLEALMRCVLLWAQPAAGAASTAGASNAASAAPQALVHATTELEAALKLPRARELAAAAAAALRRLAPAATATAAAHIAGLLRGVSPLLGLAAEALRARGLRLLALHRSTAKLSYVCTAVLATLVEEGYCVPEEGKEVEGGDGPGEFKEAEGTGLGDGTGAKDISDQLENQDQLLGAQQRGQQPEPQEEQQDKGAGPEEENKGIEMDDDFEGALHDVPTDERDRNRDSEDEEGDEDRIDQQMGDVGDNEEVVDERLWNDEDDKGGDPDEQKKKKEEKYEKDAPIQVEDKTDLEYAAGQQDEQQDGPAKEPPKKEQKKEKDQGADDARPEGGEEGEEDPEGPINEDTDDKYEDRNHTAPQAAEEELELPEEMNLDGGEQEQEEGQGQGEEEQQGQEAEAEQGGKEEGKEEPQGQEAMQEDGGKDGGEEDGGEEQPGGDGGDGDVDMEEQDGGAGGIGEAEQPQPEPEAPQPEEQPDAMAVDRADEEDPAAAEQQQPEGAEQQQAGPRGVASGAPTEQPESTGAAHGAPEARPQPLQPRDGDAAGRQPQAAQHEPPQAQHDPNRAPDAAPEARQADAGMASASQAGAPAPLAGGEREPGPEAAAQREQQRGGGRRQQEPNPLRNLGDALERWRANLAVQHEAAQREQQPDEAALAEEEQGEGGEPPAGSEFQFLGAEEAARAGDTQALAPATEEQAAAQAQELEESGLLQQRREEQRDAAAGEDGAVAMEEEQEGGEQGGEEGEGPQRPAVVSGPLPRTWGGQQRKAQLGAEEPEGEGGDGEEQEQRPSAEELLRRQEAGEDGEEDDEGAIPSRVVARLANASLRDDDEDAATAAGDALQPAPRGLAPEQVEALRQQLDERLRGAAAAATDADLAYGGEVWSRCEALVSGLAGELTEQLRLILEPTLASKLAGDYRTGKRINMKKVIGYIASHFRRDKIWLRRNRPDKRRYQVLLACDDSRSMAENGCGGFALEALALICKAMSRLEVGQVGVLKFGGGEGVVPLHPLDAPFADSVGPSLAARLTFRQDNTIADRPMLQLMASLDHMLAAARHSSGAGGIGAGTSDLAQLVLILADGRFHEKESMHAAVREAAAKRGVCLAFIVLDNPSNSLLDMQSVSFAAGKPVFTKYLDSFPFPYYIVLRDIASLPATLADLLRQWFELSAV